MRPSLTPPGRSQPGTRAVHFVSCDGPAGNGPRDKSGRPARKGLQGTACRTASTHASGETAVGETRGGAYHAPSLPYRKRPCGVTTPTALHLVDRPLPA
ncbi:hypothetical protein [Streptomyces carpinensis]|uniref:Uncharacterized protein n=1 Tax=Streptomyces carpinensis TaxID=66369 RepID=A0ABV1W9E0_9ACTN|nr:hypothetical protein [Streptomyces carpinensis]